MSVAFGLDLRVDRVPAVVVPPLKPVIQGMVVSHARPVHELTAIKAGSFDLGDNKPTPHVTYEIYSPQGEQSSAGQPTGSKLNIYI